MSPIRVVRRIGIIGNVVAAYSALGVLGKGPVSGRQSRVEDVFPVLSFCRKEHNHQPGFVIE